LKFSETEKKASLSFWKNNKIQGEAFENIIDNQENILPFFPSASISNNNDIITIVSYELCNEETSKVIKEVINNNDNKLS